MELKKKKKVEKNKEHNFKPKPNDEQIQTQSLSNPPSMKKLTSRLGVGERLTAIGRLYEEKRMNLVKKKEIIEKEKDEKYIEIQN